MNQVPSLCWQRYRPLNIDWKFRKVATVFRITRRRRIIRSTFQVILCAWKTYLPLATRNRHTAHSCDCVYSPTRLCPPLCLPLPRKRESLHSSFERKGGARRRGGGRMDVDAPYTYNRRLTMSLPAAAAERQFRVNLQNDGIRYPSYKLPSPLSSSPLPPSVVGCLLLLNVIYRRGEALIYRA